MKRLMFALSLLALAPALTSIPSWSGEKPKRNQLAVLIAVPEMDAYREAAGNDLAAVQRTLRAKGYLPEEILALSGPVTRPMVLAYLSETGKRLAKWQNGSVFLYYTGSGHVAKGVTAGKIPLDKVGWDLGSGETLSWKEVFDSLQAPQGVRITLLPDCCFTNLLANQLPANVSGIILGGDPGDINCRAQNHLFTIDGKRTAHGVITHFALRSLEQAKNIGEWRQIMVSLEDLAVRAKELPTDKSLPMATVGDGKLPVLGLAN